MATQGSRSSHVLCEKKRFVEAFTTSGVPCVLETRVGLLAAVVEPSSANIRVAEPARTSARDLTLALSARLCCVTRASLLADDDKTLLMNCKRCHRSTTGDTVYVYMSMGFCSKNCRYVHHLDDVEKYKKRLAMVLMERSKIVTRMVASKANSSSKLATQASCRPTFFTCVEADSLQLVSSPSIPS
ncbi:hypothetical protein HU200_016998 [Digitaria exilis]|uniref:FLZ-type domain-containing protein n=1 Tax=Digitaria exilis TaxID=1010633 RepID=A0A835F761_9POAL|nr:hypothetical protein HU200_016998 [Digitaria exilis]